MAQKYPAICQINAIFTKWACHAPVFPDKGAGLVHPKGIYYMKTETNFRKMLAVAGGLALAVPALSACSEPADDAAVVADDAAMADDSAVMADEAAEDATCAAEEATCAAEEATDAAGDAAAAATEEVTE
ncbi:hypothetical protein [Parasphingorhabdus sp.]|uniref:hypothetical protein n=1 Tax=Parasphingorhabdus sp. TaxID=2709688 RepID=UPI0035948BBB